MSTWQRALLRCCHCPGMRGRRSCCLVCRMCGGWCSRRVRCCRRVRRVRGWRCVRRLRGWRCWCRVCCWRFWRRVRRVRRVRCVGCWCRVRCIRYLKRCWHRCRGAKCLLCRYTCCACARASAATVAITPAVAVSQRPVCVAHVVAIRVRVQQVREHGTSDAPLPQRTLCRQSAAVLARPHSQRARLVTNSQHSWCAVASWCVAQMRYDQWEDRALHLSMSVSIACHKQVALRELLLKPNIWSWMINLSSRFGSNDPARKDASLAC